MHDLNIAREFGFNKPANAHGITLADLDSPTALRTNKPYCLPAIRLDAAGFVAGLVMLPLVVQPTPVAPGSFRRLLNLALGRLRRLRESLLRLCARLSRTGRQQR